MSRNTCKFTTELLKLDIMVEKMKLFDYKNLRKFKELNHFSVVRNGNVQFPCEIRCSHVFPGDRNLHKHSSASQDAMTHSGYISACSFPADNPQLYCCH